MRLIPLSLVLLSVMTVAWSHPAPAQQCVPGQCLPQTQGPLTVTVPSTRYPTVQAGINAVGNGGTVRVKAGVYVEAIRIAGKTLTLKGLGTAAAPTEIRALAEEQAVITFGDQGSGTLENLTLTGGAYGILTASETQQWQPQVILNRLLINGAGRGVFGTFDVLYATNVKVSASRFNGLSILGARALRLVNLSSTDSGNIGIFAQMIVRNDGTYTGEPWIALNKVTVTGSKGPGIAIIGNAAAIMMTHVVSTGNHLAGVYLENAPATLIQCDLSGNLALADESFGDGLVSFYSKQVTILDSTFVANQRSGITVTGCSGDGRPSNASLGNNTITDGAFYLDVEIAPDCTAGGRGQMEDLTGNECWHDGVKEDMCTAVSSTMEMIEATP
jgi:hypothetical protein